MQKNLIIWDFDGVLADSEHLWVQNWADTLQKLYNFTLTPEMQKQYLEGKADKTKVELLAHDFPQLKLDDKFWAEIHQNEDRLIASELTLTENIEQILDDKDFAQCVATGATLEKHNKKTVKLGLGKYFAEHNTFTAYMVANGKPAPDIFLYAAKTMGFAPQHCLVIEDSLAGIKAAKAADIPVIAYIGATGHNTKEYTAACKEAGAFAVSDNMLEIHQLIKEHFSNK
ncbi:MAG: HAD family phosphatase [Alphaproteobacteria bacterium]|nr:HAD family phosphatase [Alphaproteobacteria bacterium]